MNIDTLLASAMKLHNQGNLREAEKYYRAILSKEPKHVDALHYLGVIALQFGQHGAAIDLISKSLASSPNNAAALGNLGNAYQGINNFAQAIDVYKKSLSISPVNVQIRANLGNACKQLMRFEEALQYYLQVLENTPNLPEVERNLAEIYAATGAIPKALETIRRAIHKAPNSVELLTSYGNMLKQVGQLPEAVKQYSAVVNILPNNLNAKSSLGICLAEIGDFDQAIALLTHVSDKSIGSADAHYNVAFVYYDAGYFDQTIVSLTKALHLAPDFVNARVLLSKCENQLDDSNIKAMEKLLDKASLDDASKASLAYAIGNHYERQLQFETAFQYLSFANKLSRKQTTYDFKKDKEAFSNIRNVFNKSFFEKQNFKADLEAKPVFIVGMPRSGSTLVEQILSSHSAFFGIGEMPILANCIHHIFGLKSGIDCTSGVLSGNNIQFERLALDYLQQIKSMNSKATLVSDKLLMNFFHIGLIKLIFPNAVIIHCKRDPIATCWSIYKSNFSNMGHDYGQSLEELGHFYRLYQDLMSHWHSLFPGEIYDVSYEILVAEQIIETKNLVEACGLEWESACLDFHKNKRRVATLSASQVRKPLYNSALASWKPFEKNISELINVLKSN